MKKTIIMVILFLCLGIEHSGATERTLKQSEQFVLEEQNETVFNKEQAEIKHCSEKVLIKMQTLWTSLKTERSLGDQITKSQKQYNEVDIATMYCETAVNYGVNVDDLVIIGMVETKFNPCANFNNKGWNVGLQQVNVGIKGRPTKSQMLDAKLNLRESARILKAIQKRVKNRYTAIKHYNGSPRSAQYVITFKKYERVINGKI